MKNVISIVFILLSVNTKAQVASSCNVPPELAAAYHKDIVQLVTDYLFQIQSPDTIFVHPPQQTVDEISGGLAAILNAGSIPESDSVFNLYCVHNLMGWPYDYAGFLVQVDTNHAWTQAWQNLVTVTGNTFMDSLTSQYALHITNFYNWSIGNYAELSVDSAWNIMALMDSLAMTPGVLFVEPNSLIGQAGWIEYSKNGGDRYYDFYFEFNDCFDGCDNYHQWSFKVDADCAVYYIGFTDWGVFGISPLPAPVNCNLFTTVPVERESDFIVYPNPVGDKLSINSWQLPIKTVSVYNQLGELVLAAFFPTANRTLPTEFDVSRLSPGIYWLVIPGVEKSKRIRFVKN